MYTFARKLTGIYQSTGVTVNFWLNQIPKAAYWALPAGIAGAWFVYPALSEQFKHSVGLPNTFGISKGAVGPLSGVPQAQGKIQYEQESLGVTPNVK